jgi:hypothetical protein
MERQCCDDRGTLEQFEFMMEVHDQSLLARDSRIEIDPIRESLFNLSFVGKKEGMIMVQHNPIYLL